MKESASSMEELGRYCSPIYFLTGMQQLRRRSHWPNQPYAASGAPIG